MNKDTRVNPISLLSLQGIRKQYPAVLANDDISLEVMPGQIHAILGENGAGKSTLMKIIYGAVQPDAGDIRFNGQPVHIRNPQQPVNSASAWCFSISVCLTL